MRKAEPLLKQSFALPSNLLVQVVNKREWPAFLLARNRPSEALEAAKVLIGHANPVVQATGHIEAGFVMLATRRFGDARHRVERGAESAEKRAPMARRWR